MKNGLNHFYKQKFGTYSKLVVCNAIFFSLLIILFILKFVKGYKSYEYESAVHSNIKPYGKLLWMLYITAMMIPQYMYFAMNLKNVDFKLFIELLISGHRLKIPLDNSS
jgi:hypothetical protein